MKVYLAGGMHNTWRTTVLNECWHKCSAEFLDPTTHSLTNEDEYTAWDLLNIKQSDIVFAYMDNENPSGYGLCVEVGYAKALGKTIILVIDYLDNLRDQYFGMVRSCADVVVNNLDDGINLIKEFSK